MKIAVVAPSPVPFRLGGAERLVKGLTDALNTSTAHDAELVKLPSREHDLPDLMATYRSFSELDLSHFDVVVSTKYPSWMVQHPRHVVYMVHPLRGLYDQYPVRRPPLPDRHERSIGRLLDALAAPDRGTAVHHTIFARWEQCLEELGADHPAFEFPGSLSRALIHRLDGLALSPARMAGHCAISRTVAERPGYFPVEVRPQAVIPPSDLQGVHAGDYRGFFTASRLERPKRIDLVIGAMRFVTADVTLTIAGTGPLSGELRRLAAADRRISFVGHISDRQLLQEYANALAVPFVPEEEDLGYIAVEAMRAAKPVITCTDSGGPTELVHNGSNGFVVEPSAAALGRVMQRLASDRSMAARLGSNARASTASITWQPVIDQLLRGADMSRGRSSMRLATSGRRNRPRVIVLATYRVAPQTHGGTIRCAHLYAALANHCDVTYICLDTSGASAGTTRPYPGLTQVVVPTTAAFDASDRAYVEQVGLPMNDITTATDWTTVPLLATTIQRESRTADLAILAQPYLLPALRSIAPHLPFVYDAQNAEFVLKTHLLGATSVGAELAAVVEVVERRAVRSAELVVTCSETDRSNLGQLGPTLADWALAPNGADVGTIPFVTGRARVEGRRAWLRRFAAVTGRTYEELALFVGSYHPPNISAGETVIRVAETMPDVLFVLAGDHARHFNDWPLADNVLVRGIVPKAELHRLLGIASVALNPVDSGGGSNLKLVEYFAAGVPVISSELGSRGFAVREGEHLRIVDNAELATSIRAIATDADAARRAAAARRFAEDECDWELIGTHFSEVILGVIGLGRSKLQRSSEPDVSAS